MTDPTNLVLTHSEMALLVQGLVEVSLGFPPIEKESLAIAKKLGQEDKYVAARNFRLERRRLHEESLRKKA